VGSYIDCLNTAAAIHLSALSQWHQIELSSLVKRVWQWLPEIATLIYLL
jgi:hypothetical protein